MHAAPRHQPAAERDALRGVVVAADDERVRHTVRQLHQKIVQQRDRFGRRDGLVVHVARDEHAVRPVGIRILHHLRQHGALIGNHRKSVHNLP